MMKIILRGTSANKEGHDGTGLHGCPIEALYVIVVWPYKWEERFFHRLNFNQKKDLNRVNLNEYVYISRGFG